MKNGLIYARVSTEEQAKEGQSIESQLRISTQYAKENDISIIDKFVDEGKSATNMNRPALQDMLGVCQDKNQHIDSVIVQDTDRLARNTLDHLKIKAILKKHKIQLIAVSQPTIDDSPEGNLMDTLLAATNAFQSQITGRKTSKVMEQKAQIGWFPGGVPVLGYRNADNPSPNSTLDRRIIVIDESTAPAVAEAFKMYSSGNYNTQQITKFLSDKGIKSPKGVKLHRSLVVRSLKNQFYRGTFIWKDKKYKGKHELFIDQSTFDEVQRVIAIHNANTSRKRKHNFLLKGLLFCDDCDHRMQGEMHEKGGRLYSFYYCPQCRKGTYTASDELEAKIGKVMQKIEISAEYKKQVMELAETILEESRLGRNGERLRLQKEIDKYERALTNAEDDRYMKHILTSDDFSRLSDRYKETLTGLRSQLTNLDLDHSEKLVELEKILTLAEDIGHAYSTATPQLQREYLILFFSKFLIEDGKVTKYTLKPDVKDLIKEGSVRLTSIELPR